MFNTGRVSSLSININSKILWVDDRPEELAKHFVALEARGFKVVVARSPSEGYSLMEKEKFDIVALDLDYPEPANPQLLLENTRKYCPTAKIIVISEWMDMDDFRRAIERSKVKPVVEPKPLPGPETAAFLKIFVRLAVSSKSESPENGNVESKTTWVEEPPKIVKNSVWVFNRMRENPFVSFVLIIAILAIAVVWYFNREALKGMVGI